MSIRSKIQALITAANTKTGGSDTTLTDAVQTLVDWYGQGGGFHETGTVSFHTGEVLKTLTIPISAEAEALDNYVIAVRPIKTWALVDGVWVERDSLDFTGINGFKSGNWNPALAYVIGGKAKLFNSVVFRNFVSRGVYSNGVKGNANENGAVFSLVDGNLVTSSNALNGSCVCVADGGLTFEYHIWGWS